MKPYWPVPATMALSVSNIRNRLYYFISPSGGATLSIAWALPYLMILDYQMHTKLPH